MIVSQNLQPGDFLVFQLEAGFALLRLLCVDGLAGDRVWHVAASDDFFLDVETAEAAATDSRRLSIRADHMAVTNRAFESTQVAKIANVPLTSQETAALNEWYADSNHEVSDRSVRLLLGLR